MKAKLARAGTSVPTALTRRVTDRLSLMCADKMSPIDWDGSCGRPGDRAGSAFSGTVYRRGYPTRRRRREPGGDGD